MGAKLAASKSQHEVAIAIDAHPPRAVEAQLDGAGIGVRRDDEIVFELPLSAVIGEVDAGPHVAVFDPAVSRDVGAPLRRIVADEIIRLSR